MQEKPNRHLRREDRDVIHRMSQRGCSQTEISEAIGFGQPTISKELRRNVGKRGYRPKQADEMASKRKRSKNPRHRVIVGETRDEVLKRLNQQHSPEQIHGALKKEGKPAPSHESIYKFVVEDKRQGGSLHKNLRINGKRRYRRRCKANRTKIPNRVPLEERPEEVDRKERFGDWEVDLVEGAKGSGYILSLYERKSMYAVLKKLETKTSAETSEAIIHALSSCPTHTLTYDNGSEFSQHEEVSRRLEVEGYG